MSKELDKFYTKPEVVLTCYQQVGDLSQFDLVVEPSAGNGAFLLPNIPMKAYDIAPEDERIQKADYLQVLTPTIVTSNKKVLTVGNPPFGRNCSLALQFIKKAMEYSDTVAFVLPKSFKKVSIQNKVPLTFHLVSTLDLPPSSFLLDGQSYDVPCIFQVWKRGITSRSKQATRTTTDLFRFVKKNDEVLKPVLTIRRVGVYAGMAYPEVEKSEQSHYFIALPENSPTSTSEFIRLCNSIAWEHDNTSGPRSISKGELIDKMEALLAEHV